VFNPVRICEILNEEHVDFVVLGGFAAIVRGSSLPTQDIDFIPSREQSNLDRLGRALTRMNAMIRAADEAVPTKIDGRFLANVSHILNLVTDFGEIDLTFTPAGSAHDYEGWSRNATPEEIDDGVTILVASLDDIIDSKRMANRPKDQMALPYLESLRDEIRRQSNE
jgi:hypothetical protein